MPHPGLAVGSPVVHTPQRRSWRRPGSLRQPPWHRRMGPGLGRDL